MPAPTAYTEESLAEYMHTALGPVASALKYSVEGESYAEAVNEALLAFPVDDIADVSGRDNIRKLRMLALFFAWKMVAAHTAGDFDYSADNAGFSRSQVHAQAKASMEALRTDLLEFDPAYAVTVTTVTHRHDPYTHLEDEARTL